MPAIFNYLNNVIILSSFFHQTKDTLQEKLLFPEMLAQYNNAPNLLLLGAPVMFFFVLLEYWYSNRNRLNLYNNKELLASTVVGLSYVAITAATGIFTIYTVWFTYYYFTPQWLITPITWWSFILCMLVYDFCRYWAHRVAHEQRFWWASHITHHSSENYNFTVSFRLCWVDQVKLIFFLPVVVLGFNPILFFIVHQISVLYQFWQHSELIRPMPAWVEFLFVTPTNHKIHHGKNEVYIDKNYGSLLTIWDRMFGTYVNPSEKPIYGVKQPIKSMNPVYLVFHEYVDIFNDLRKANTWKERRVILFGRPGSYDKTQHY